MPEPLQADFWAGPMPCAAVFQEAGLLEEEALKRNWSGSLPDDLESVGPEVEPAAARPAWTVAAPVPR